MGVTLLRLGSVGLARQAFSTALRSVVGMKGEECVEASVMRAELTALSHAASHDGNAPRRRTVV